MKFKLPALTLFAFMAGVTACTAEVERVCPSLPDVDFSPDPSVPYGVKDNLQVTLRPFAIEDGEKFTCPATVCFTLDGSEPQKGRASTYCYPAPIKEIPIRRTTEIKYFVEGVNGSQSTVQSITYRVEPPPVSTCDPKPKSSREKIDVNLVSSKPGVIFYTLDGSDPDPENESGETLSGNGKSVQVKIDFEGTTTLKFRAQDEAGNLEEKVNTCEYVYDATPPETTFDPAGKSSAGPVTVKLETSELARIYYTTDGSEPDPTRLADSQLGTTKIEYSEASITLNESAFLRFYAIDYVGNEESPIQEQAYIIGGKPAVGISPQPGPQEATAIVVTLRAQGDAGHATEIWYTTNGDTPTAGGTSKKYAAPITDFNKEGDFVLKYLAKDTVSNLVSGPYTAEYTLGSSGRPFYPVVDFNNAAKEYDAVASSKKVEYNAKMGYARLRRKIPAQIASVDSVAGVNPYDFPQELAIIPNYLVYAAGNALRVYPLESLAATSANNLPEQTGFFTDWCSNSSANGALLGVNLTVSNGNLYAITPFTSRLFNCGGFAKWTLNYSAPSTHPYVKSNLPQFANTTADPFVADVEEANDAADPTLVNLPRSGSAVIDGAGEDVLYLPRFRADNYYVDAFSTSTGALRTQSTSVLSGRPIAVEASPTGDLIAVGDSVGNVYTLNPATLTVVDTEIVPCPAGKRCRVNGLAWHVGASGTHLLAAVGHYGGTEGGQIAVIKVNAGGPMSLVEDEALPAADPFSIAAIVESVAVVPDNDYAVVALRSQGFVVLSLANVATGVLNSRGYITPSDVGDNAFWATDVTPFPALTNNRVAVLDAGRTEPVVNAQGQTVTPAALDAGFRIFEFTNVERWENSGALVTQDLNTSKKPISRVRLMQVSSGQVIGNQLPPGLTIKLIADGVENTQPMTVDTEIAFTSQPVVVKAKLEFASPGPDTGATTVQIDSLQFKFTPVE